MKKLVTTLFLCSFIFCAKNSGVQFSQTSYDALLQKADSLGMPIMVDVFSDG